MEEKLLIGVYCRVSSLSQKEEGVGLENQKEEGIRFCESKGFDYRVYMDDISGMKNFDERKMFNELRKDLLDKKINGIWIWNVGRGWRDDRYKWEFIDLINQSNGKLFSMGREFDLNDKNDLMIVGMSSLFYDFNRRDLLDNMIGGRRVKWSKGVGFSGGVGFGYKRIKEKGESIIVIDEDRSKVVKDIYKTFVRKDVLNIKDSWGRIIKKYPQYKDEINYDKHYQILKSDRYKGKRILVDKKLDKEYEFKYERIIEDEMYDKVKNKWKKIYGVRKGNSKSKYLLKGKMKCQCGENMWLLGGSGKYKYYHCNSKKYDNKKEKFNSFKGKDYKGKCKYNNNSKIGLELIEKVVWDSLYKFLDNSETLKNEYKKRYEKKLGNKNSFVGKKKYYEMKLEEWEEMKNNNVSYLLNNTLNEKDFKDWKKNKFDVEVDKIKLRLKEIDKELSKMELNENVVEDYIEIMKSDLEKEKSLSGFKDRLKKINQYIEEIVVKNKDKNNWVLDIKLSQNLNDNGVIEVNEKSKNLYINFVQTYQKNNQ